ncbi:hypothetical protein DQ04_00411110 [Trypanosoma grayi]|uniref:hypothetical protein n=1 Tax=Trypanosoma grayi TaxID=71804 RepID=UPI0004F3F98C|nr:hypothetical protein DQ04_00411110 [Trypanosoma grayi]KEG14547.1 hypothetical protein DQ04_00411110 [Trypanosoma grayi]
MKSHNNNNTDVSVTVGAADVSASTTPDEICPPALLPQPPPIEKVSPQPQPTPSLHDDIEEDAADVWDIKRMLFSLKDQHTGVVSHIDAAERLRSMALLDEWMINKLFHDSGWLRQLQTNGEEAPRYRSVVGEYKILRYLLHRFLSDESMWYDELSELMQCILGWRLKANGGATPDGDEDETISLGVPRTLLAGSEKMNFYTNGVQDALWEFLHTKRGSFGGPGALWYAFVASHRNMLSLPSPQRPPFSGYEHHPALSEAEFAEVTRPTRAAGDDEASTKLIRGVTLHWPEEWNPSATEQEVSAVNDADATLPSDDERRKFYSRDEFYMSLVMPDETALAAVCDAPVGASLLPHAEQQVNLSHTHQREERGLLNPVNGEIEDFHLTRLWDVFQKMRLEDNIDIYRAVCGRLESMQAEVFADMMARKGLLLLFFARDEVRALTSPAVTYRRLWCLHTELNVLASWVSSSCCSRQSPPPSFEMLPLSSRLSFSCFAQEHVPMQRSMYRLDTAAASPAHLYYRYCQLYPHIAVRGGYDPQPDAANRVSEKPPDAPSVLLDPPAFPRFEWLTELQQLAFQFPFENIASSPGQIGSNISATVSCSPQNPSHSEVTETSEPNPTDRPSTVVKRRGRARRAVEPVEPEAAASTEGDPVIEEGNNQPGKEAIWV